jgi:hypothetical protein
MEPSFTERELAVLAVSVPVVVAVAVRQAVGGDRNGDHLDANEYRGELRMSIHKILAALAAAAVVISGVTNDVAPLVVLALTGCVLLRVHRGLRR